MDKFDNFLKYIVQKMSYVSVLGIMLLLFLVMADVILRFTVSGAIPGGISFSSLILAIMVFFAIAHAQRKKEHISVDLFVDFLLPKTTRRRRYWDVIVYITAIIFFFLIFWASIEDFQVSYQMKEYLGGASIRVHLWPARGALLIGCFVMIIQLVRDLIQTIITGTTTEH